MKIKNIIFVTAGLFFLTVPQVIANPFKISFKPTSSTLPKFSVGGAVRGDVCAADKLDKGEIKAFVDANSLIASDLPEVFAFVPELNGDKNATFIVKDATEDYYEEALIQIPQAGGVIKLTLDENAPKLSPNTSYNFYLRLQCGNTPSVEDPIVGGTLNRVDFNIAELAKLSPEIRLQALVKKGLWYDSLSVADDLAQAGNDLYWNQLVDAVN